MPIDRFSVVSKASLAKLSSLYVGIVSLTILAKKALKVSPILRSSVIISLFSTNAILLDPNFQSERKDLTVFLKRFASETFFL